MLSCEKMVKKVDHRGNKFLIRLEAGKYAYLGYHTSGNVLYIDSTFVPEEYRGGDLAETLTKAVVEHARQKGLKIVPVCSYAQRYFEVHMEHKDLLAEGT